MKGRTLSKEHMKKLSIAKRGTTRNGITKEKKNAGR